MNQQAKYLHQFTYLKAFRITKTFQITSPRPIGPNVMLIRGTQRRPA